MHIHNVGPPYGPGCYAKVTPGKAQRYMNDMSNPFEQAEKTLQEETEKMKIIKYALATGAAPAWQRVEPDVVGNKKAYSNDNKTLAARVVLGEGGGTAVSASDLRALRRRAAGETNMSQGHMENIHMPWWTRLSNVRVRNSNTWAQGMAFIWKGSQAFDRATALLRHPGSQAGSMGNTITDMHTFTANAVTTLTHLGGLDKNHLLTELQVIKEGMQEAIAAHPELGKMGALAHDIVEEGQLTFQDHWWCTWTQPKELGMMLRMHHELFGNRCSERQQLLTVTRHTAECIATGMAHFDQEGLLKEQGNHNAQFSWAKFVNKNGKIHVSTDETSKDDSYTNQVGQANVLDAIRSAMELVHTTFKLHQSNDFIRDGTRLKEECDNIRKCTDDWPVLLKKTGTVGALAMLAAAKWDGKGLEGRKLWDLIEAHSTPDTDGRRLYTAPFSEGTRKFSQKQTVCLDLTLTLRWLPQILAELNASPIKLTQGNLEAELVNKIERQKVAALRAITGRLQELMESLRLSQDASQEGKPHYPLPTQHLEWTEKAAGITTGKRRAHHISQTYADRTRSHSDESELHSRAEKAAATQHKINKIRAADSTAIGGLLMRGAIKDLPSFARGLLAEGPVKCSDAYVRKIKGAQHGIVVHVYIHMSGKPWADFVIKQTCTTAKLLGMRAVKAFTGARRGLWAHKLPEFGNGKQAYADSNYLDERSAIKGSSTFCDGDIIILCEGDDYRTPTHGPSPVDLRAREHIDAIQEADHRLAHLIGSNGTPEIISGAGMAASRMIIAAEAAMVAAKGRSSEQGLWAATQLLRPFLDSHGVLPHGWRTTVAQGYGYDKVLSELTHIRRGTVSDEEQAMHVLQAAASALLKDNPLKCDTERLNIARMGSALSDQAAIELANSSVNVIVNTLLSWKDIGELGCVLPSTAPILNGFVEENVKAPPKMKKHDFRTLLNLWAKIGNDGWRQWVGNEGRWHGWHRSSRGKSKNWTPLQQDRRVWSPPIGKRVAKGHNACEKAGATLNPTLSQDNTSKTWSTSPAVKNEYTTRQEHSTADGDTGRTTSSWSLGKRAYRHDEYRTTESSGYKRPRPPSSIKFGAIIGQP